MRETSSARRWPRWLSALIALAAPALVVAAAALTSTPADARPRHAGAPAPKSSATARGAAPKGDAGAMAPGALTPAAPTAASPAATGPTDAGLVESKILDGGTHVFKFGEMDIEGRLKSPQLVYFLRRVRAEFAAGDLGHRSFMREMSETRKEPTF